MAKQDFLEFLTDNPARARILRTLVLNPNDSFSEESLAKRAKTSASAVVREVKALASHGIIKGTKHTVVVPAKPSVQGKAKKGRAAKPGKSTRKTETMWRASAEFRFARPLSAFVHEVAPVKYDDIVEGLKRSGKLAAVILSGTFMGDPTRPADLLVAADMIDDRRLESAVKRLEPAYGREIRYASFSTHEFQYRMTVQDRLLRDTLEYPHLVLFDRTRLLS
jgi:DNA-binding Lrp family transcriptional regulator